MKIREKLTIQFSTIVGLILILFSLSIFFISKYYRYNAFKVRLTEKALNTANLLIEVQQIDLNLLKNLRRNYLQALPDEFVRIYDQNNNAVFKDDTVNYNFSPETFNEVRNSGELEFNIGDRQFVAIPFKSDYVIVASAVNRYGKLELENLAYILLIGNLIGILVIYLAGRFFAKQALSPVSKMIKDVDSIGETNLSLRLDEGKKKDELAQLAMTFNRLFSRIEEAFERQKRFVSNASHELRTPLTTITGEIEVALMKSRTQEQYEEVLLSVLEEARTLTKLSNDLLKLTQTGDIEGLVIHKVIVMDLLQAITEECYKRYDKELLNVEMHNSGNLTSMYISGSLELLKIALVNIVDNAFKFSDGNKVGLILTQDFDSIKITVKDQGIGMTEEELGYIFQPFYRSNNVISIPGSGIGLSLTQKIVKLHGGRIEVFSQPNQGTEVTVFLPYEKDL